MSNKDKVVTVLERLCAQYKIMPEKKFQLRAISTATSNLKAYGGDISSGKDAAKKVSGVGKGMIRRIDEILDKGDLDELKSESGGSGGGAAGAAKRAKKGDKGIINVTGIGPVAAKKLTDKGYGNIDELRSGVMSGDVKLTHHQKLGVKYYDDFLERIPHNEMVKMETLLKETLVAISGSGGSGYMIEVCGSYRRGKKDCGDIDVLMTYNGMKKANPAFVKMYIKFLVDRGFIIDHLTTNIKTKYMGICRLEKSGVARRIDIRSVPYHCFYPALIYFTGSKEFNIEIRRKALEKGYSLSEYGFKKVDDNSMVTFNSEKEIFDFLGLDFVDPTKR